MSQDNRGMSVAQAKQLAADPKTSPGVMVRLANGYPEVRATLLQNPAIYPELRAWIENAMAVAEPAKATETRVLPAPRVPVTPKKVVTHTPKRKRRRGRAAKTFATLIPTFAVIFAMFGGVNFVSGVTPEPGIITAQDIRTEPNGAGIWHYDMSVSSDSGCTDFSLKTYDQDLAVVLIQNDLGQQKCKNLKKPTPSTLALLNTRTGRELWKVNLADELDWTPKWRKEVVAVPGLNEILVKFIDINGQDADGEPADGDTKGIDRKVKTLVPYSKLNGRVTDPVIAQSKAQPPMKSGVIEVIPIPGDSKNVLLMTNGAKKDFRYAKYRSKKLTDEDWSFESNLQPLGGMPLVGTKLVLGRKSTDEAIAIRIRNGEPTRWMGEAGGSIFNIGTSTIHVDGKAMGNKLDNVEAQGGKEGRATVITGINESGEALWSIDCDGYAISRSETVSTLANRTRYSELYTITGTGSDRKLDRIDPAGGTSLWQASTPNEFEISRLSSPDFGIVYLTPDGATEAETFKFFDLATGSLTAAAKLSSSQERVDGMSVKTAFLVDEPEREQVSADVNAGNDVNLRPKDKKKGNRTCVQALDMRTAHKLWQLTCNENEHILRVGGRWLLVDETPGEERVSPLVSALRSDFSR